MISLYENGINGILADEMVTSLITSQSHVWSQHKKNTSLPVLNLCCQVRLSEQMTTETAEGGKSKGLNTHFILKNSMMQTQNITTFVTLNCYM